MAYNFPSESRVGVSDIFFRTISGFFGGGFGSLVLLIGIPISGTVSSLSLTEVVGEGIHPLVVFILLVIMYVSLLISALASLTFFYYCDRDRYPFLLSSLSHVFALITLIFVVSTPLSLLLSFSNFTALGIIGLILLGLSTIFSVITMEVVANHKHLLLTLYSSAIALFTFFLLMVIFYFALGSITSIKTTSYIFVLAMPFCWASFGFWQVSFEMIYQWTYQLYGSDFLNSTTRVGSDYIKEQRMKKI
ncbi:MAG: hypothetical protein Q8P95_00645 [bacterium]|nr:hypothetical protein [bacterium]